MFLIVLSDVGTFSNLSIGVIPMTQCSPSWSLWQKEENGVAGEESMLNGTWNFLTAKATVRKRGSDWEDMSGKKSGDRASCPQEHMVTIMNNYHLTYGGNWTSERLNLCLRTVIYGGVTGIMKTTQWIAFNFLGHEFHWFQLHSLLNGLEQCKGEISHYLCIDYLYFDTYSSPMEPTSNSKYNITLYILPILFYTWHKEANEDESKAWESLLPMDIVTHQSNLDPCFPGSVIDLYHGK